MQDASISVAFGHKNYMLQTRLQTVTTLQVLSQRMFLHQVELGLF
jgi:hypothetical protein